MTQPIPLTKLCSVLNGCGQLLPISAFAPVHKDEVWPVQSMCRDCQSAYNTRRRIEEAASPAPKQRKATRGRKRARARTKPVETAAEEPTLESLRRTGAPPEMKIQSLREENANLRRQRNEAIQGQTVAAAITKGVEIGIRDLALRLPTFDTPYILKTRADDDLKVEEAVLLQSCWHYGEVVSREETAGFGGYDIATCQARIQEMTDSVIGLITDHHRGLRIRKLWVVNVGDNISGDIHDELRVTNEVPLVSQFLGCGLLQALSLRDLATVVEEVEFIGLRGNHPRNTKKPAYKQSAEDSFDRASYAITSLAVAGIPNIKVTIPNSPRHLQRINGHGFLFEHGDSIKTWMSIPFYGAQREQASLSQLYHNAAALLPNDPKHAAYLQQGFRYFCIGNFHTFVDVDGPAGSRTIFTGSPKGPDEYALGKLATGSQPSQTFFGVHEKRGISFMYRLDLSRSTPKSHSRYQFDTPNISIRDAAHELGLL